MDYTHYRPEDFLRDESFQDWVTHGDASPQAGFWRDWIKAHPDKIADVAEARRLLLGIRFRTDVLPDADVARLKRAILQATGEADVPTLPLNSRRATRRTWLAAATVLLATALGVGYYWQIGRYTEHRTAYGELQTVRLPDGSTVVLNAHSRLKYLTNWPTEAERTVWLTGEAYFDVTHQTHGQPFRVRTEAVTVDVLGTRFNVAERRTRTVVTLDRGHIRLGINEENGTPLDMHPGESVSVPANDQPPRRTTVPPATAGDWTAQRWVLHQTPLADVAERIELTFGKRVVVTDSALLREPMSGVLPTTSLIDLLDVLRLTYGVQTTVTTDQIILHQ